MTDSQTRLLLIEDNAGDARLIQELLSDVPGTPFVLQWAPDLARGLQRLQSQPVDIVLLDLMLPDSNGFETLRRVRERAPLVPVVVLTAVDDEVFVSQAINQGAQDYLVKGFLNGDLLSRSLRYAMDRQRMVEELEAQRAEAHRGEVRFRDLVEKYADGLLILSRDGTVLFANPAAESILGRKRAALIGKPFGIPVDTTEPVEIGIPHPDGRQAMVEMRVVRIEWEGEPVRLVSLRDVSERNQTERIRSLLASIVQSSDDAIVTQTLDGTVTSWNVAAAQLYGYSQEEVLGHPTDFLIPAERVGEEQMILESVVRGERVHHYETERVRKDGRLVEVSLTASPIRDAAGSIVGASTIARDVTERKHAERQIRRHATEMEAVNQELESFASSVSHDLRAPLRAIGSFCQILLDEKTNQLDAEGKDLLQRVRAAVQKMGVLIEDLLGLSRVTRNGMRLEPVDLTGMAQGILNELAQRSPTRNVRVLVREGLSVTGDAHLLRILLENLLNNAWKFTSKHEHATIEVGSERSEEGELVLFVRDDGAGFDVSRAGRLFQPFQRLHAAADFEGTGIGLATALRIVQRHGGRVWAEGALERGATIRFTLPKPSNFRELPTPKEL